MANQKCRIWNFIFKGYSKDDIIRASDFKYPTLLERKKARQNRPKISHFGFKYIEEFESVIFDKKSLNETNRQKNLYSWDILLNHKLTMLNNSYINAFSNFHRGIPVQNQKYTKQNRVNKLQFDFYSETYYHFLHSSREVILQILNIYYNINLKEHDMRIDGLKNSIPDDEIIAIIERYSLQIKKSLDIRHSFTHRYPKNLYDSRTKLERIDNGTRLSSASYKIMESSEIMEDINSSLWSFEKFVNDLKTRMKIS